MRAMLGYCYTVAQLTAAVIVFGTLAPKAFEGAPATVNPPLKAITTGTPPVETIPPALADSQPDLSAATKPFVAQQVPARVQRKKTVAEPPAPPRLEREKVAVGFNVPEGSFDFELTPGVFDPKPGVADPAAPPPPAPMVHPAPVMYRYGFGGRRPRPAVLRNPAVDRDNPFAANAGGAPTGGPSAFDDRPDRGVAATYGLDMRVVRESWKRDIAEFRRLTVRGVRDETLQDQFGDRYSSVKWASESNAALKDLPEPTDSYAAALKRQQRERRHH